MDILNTISLESNKQIKINFNGGDLSSDGGLLLIKEFAAKVGLIKLIILYSNCVAAVRIRKNSMKRYRIYGACSHSWNNQ